MLKLAPLLCVLALAGCGSQASNVSDVSGQGYEGEISFKDGSSVPLHLTGMVGKCALEFGEATFDGSAITVSVIAVC